ncbi:MAG TPA: citrate synthase [Acidimicrobiales bacterium]
MLESEEAARRLGVKVTTLYAYVSRGLLTSHAAPSGRRSLFAADDVERLARHSRQGKAVETRMATVTTGVTQLTDEGPVYRGRRATDLALGSTFEEVAGWLWSGAGDPTTPADPGSWAALDLGPPPEMSASDRMRWVVVMAGARDRLRADLRPPVVTARAARVAASMVEALARPAPAAGARPEVALVLPDGRRVPDALAARLAARLSPEPDPSLVRLVNAALVLMADHELATSTMAVRVAASTRADLYDVLLAGLGTIAGPLHGGASQQVTAVLAEARLHGVERAVNDSLRWQGVLPGFGHSVYQHGDARCTVLLGLFEQMASPEDVGLVRDLVGLAADHDIPPPNVDLALAAMAWATGMPPDAGRTLFSVARVAGWTAHYLEELEERPLRYRARAVYATPARPGAAGPRSVPT